MGRSQWKGQQGRCHGESLLEIQHSREEGSCRSSRRFLLCVEECLTAGDRADEDRCPVALFVKLFEKDWQVMWHLQAVWGTVVVK